MKPEKKLSNEECAEQLGIGRATVTAVRKMLGLHRGVKKVFASRIGKFLKEYQDFQASDAANRTAMEAFKQRHPEFVLPPEVGEMVVA